jgi:hypothetical protein
MKHSWMWSIAAVLPACLVCGELHGEGQPHAQYSAGSTVNVLAASGGPMMSNVSARVIIVDSGASSGNASGQELFWAYHPATLSLEWLIPHDHLVVQTTTEVAPLANSVSFPPTGADPFFQRRPRPSRPAVLDPKLSPFWCVSFQRFRPRMARVSGVSAWT